MVTRILTQEEVYEICKLQSEFNYRIAKFERRISDRQEEMQKMLKELSNNKNHSTHNEQEGT